MRAPTFACCTYCEPDVSESNFQFFSSIFILLLYYFYSSALPPVVRAAMCKVVDFVCEFDPLWLLAFGIRKTQMILLASRGDF